jgi:hypothetical protein
MLARLLHVGLAVAISILSQANAQVGPLRCADFVRNPDGSWSAIRHLAVNGVMLIPGVPFLPGTLFGGVDVAVILEMQCRFR